MDLVRAQEVRRKCPIKKKELALAIQNVRYDFSCEGALRKKRPKALAEPTLWKISRRKKIRIGGLQNHTPRLLETS